MCYNNKIKMSDNTQEYTYINYQRTVNMKCRAVFMLSCKLNFTYNCAVLMMQCFSKAIIKTTFLPQL